MEEVSLEWSGEGLEFTGRLRDFETPIDGDGRTGPNPVALLLESTGACMAIDVVDILQKGRQDLAGLNLRVEARRMENPPRYVTWINFVFEIDGDVERSKAERAVELSLDKYCSVFHSLRKDIEVETSIALSHEA